MTGKVVPLNDTFPARKPDQVTTYDLLGTSSIGYRSNPDRLVGMRGLAIYSRMAEDEQVKAVLNFKRDAITARGWQFKYRDGSKLSESQQDERKQVFSEITSRMRGSFSDALNAIMTGRAYGFSITEKVYGAVKVAKREWVGVNMLLGRDPTAFQFYTDEYGTLSKIEQRTHRQGTVEIDRRRVIHYVHAPEWDHVYGRSDLREAYRSWYIKDQISNLWPRYLERFAGGFLHAELSADNSLNDADLESLKAALERASSLGSILTPAGVKLNIHHPAATDAYERALQFHDMAIAKALLVPNLLGISHTGQTGSFAQSQTQLEAFYWTLNADAARLEACLNEQLFRDLGDQNWGDGEYPEFCFKPASLEQTRWVVQTWRDLLGAKAVVPTEEDEAFIRKLLEMPARDESTTRLTDPLEEQHRSEDAEARQEMLQQQNTVRPESNRLDESKQTPGKAEPRLLRAHTSTGQPRTVNMSTFLRAAQRVDFAVIERRHESVSEATVEDASRAMARATWRILGDQARMRELLDADTADIEYVKLDPADVGKVKAALKSGLNRAWIVGTESARREVERASGKSQFKTLKTLRNQASEYFEANGFRMAQNLSDGARSIIQQELLKSVKNGITVGDTVTGIYARLVRKGFVTLRDVDAETGLGEDVGKLIGTAESTAAYLNNLVRTNTFEALNEARFAEFTDPALEGFVEGFEYSAILDDVTTDICRQLDTLKLSADDPEWERLRPPNHYNCRSVLIPITQIDGWDGRADPVPNVEPQDGF